MARAKAKVCLHGSGRAFRCFAAADSEAAHRMALRVAEKRMKRTRIVEHVGRRRLTHYICERGACLFYPHGDGR